jgi:hypothetical protein
MNHWTMACSFSVVPIRGHSVAGRCRPAGICPRPACNRAGLGPPVITPPSTTPGARASPFTLHGPHPSRARRNTPTISSACIRAGLGPPVITPPSTTPGAHESPFTLHDPHPSRARRITPTISSACNRTGLGSPVITRQRQARSSHCSSAAVRPLPIGIADDACCAGPAGQGQRCVVMVARSRIRYSCLIIHYTQQNLESRLPILDSCVLEAYRMVCAQEKNIFRNEC